ncbi:protein of unknown function [Cupriavidus taiwanensis]|uniref:Uncharacterized protein n=1 Tax=Cupriavidus taiwanensis TaxID=164546 RepID=A0A375IHV6_9BURK|nr:protein of unknown function [Cupriavidus taiwanensis]
MFELVGERCHGAVGLAWFCLGARHPGGMPVFAMPVRNPAMDAAGHFVTFYECAHDTGFQGAFVEFPPLGWR